MHSRFRGGLLRLVVTAFLVGVATSGCYSWHARSWDQQRRIARGQTLRLTLADDSRVTLADARAAGDSVVGIAAGARRAVGVGDIRDIDARQMDAAKIGFLAAGFATADVALIGVLSAQTCGAGGGASC